MEMLVFSQPGRMELLPAWPEDFPDGRIDGIRVVGGHKLDIAWADGKLRSATIHAGRNETSEVAIGNETKTLTLKAGESHRITP